MFCKSEKKKQPKKSGYVTDVSIRLCRKKKTHPPQGQFKFSGTEG